MVRQRWRESRLRRVHQIQIAQQSPFAMPDRSGQKNSHDRRMVSRAPRLNVWLSSFLLFLILDAVWCWIAPPVHRRPSLSDNSTNEMATDSPPGESNPVFSAYAGSTSCRNCHREEFDLWQKSNHGLAERPPNLEMDGAAFTPTRTVLAGVNQATVSRKNQGFQVSKSRQNHVRLNVSN